MTHANKNRIRYKRFTITSSFNTYKYKKRSRKGEMLESTEGYAYIKKGEAVYDKNLSLTSTQYFEIIKTFFEEVKKDIVSGKTVSIPHLGSFRIGRYNVNKSAQTYRPVNWKETHAKYSVWNKENPDDKKIIFHENWHTSGWLAKILWKRPRSKHSSIYKIRWVRSSQRELGRKLLADPAYIYNYEKI